MPSLCKLDVSDNHLIKVQTELSNFGLVLDQKAHCFQNTCAITTTLISMECKSNHSLCFPPREIIASGGEKVAMYLHRFARAQHRKRLQDNIAHLQQQQQHARRLDDDIGVLPAEELAAIREERGEAVLLKTAETSASTPSSNVQTPTFAVDGVSDSECPDDDENMDAGPLEDAKCQLEAMGKPEANDLELNKSLRLFAIGTDEESLSSLLDLLNHQHGSKAQNMYGRTEWELGGTGDRRLMLKIDRLRKDLFDPLFARAQAKSPRSLKNVSRSADDNHIRHLFMTHRAVFMVAWHIYPDSKDGILNERGISAAADTIIMLQNITDAQIFVVPTASKATSIKTVEDLSAQLRRRLSKQQDGKLQIFGGGAICTQRGCEQQELMEKLATNLHSWAMTSPFYNEWLPTCVFNLQAALAGRARSGSLFVSWEEFEHQARSSGVPSSEEDLRVVTSILEDMGDMRYFGHDILQPGCHTTRLSDCLRSTVFLSWDWMMDVIGRVMHADTTQMITYFSDCDPSLASLASIFVSDGILHSRMLPFMWPCLNGNEEWPGVDSETIVRFWRHHREGSDNRAPSTSHALVCTEKASVERAYAVLIGLRFALVDADEIFYNASERLSGSLRKLKQFNKSFRTSDEADDVPSIILPSLPCWIRQRTHWQRDDTGEPSVIFQTCRAHLPAFNCPSGSTLALYEMVTVVLGPKDDLQPTSPSSPTTKQSVFDFSTRTFTSVSQEAHGKQVDVRLRRTLQISLKRHKKDSAFYIGFAAALGSSDREEVASMSASQQTITEVLNTVPLELLSWGSVRVDHTMVLYRTPASSSMIGQAFAGTDKISEVISAIGFAKVLDARIEFDRHLFYMLLSDFKGVQLLKSLMQGYKPAGFLEDMKKLFAGLYWGATGGGDLDPVSSVINELGAGVQNLDGVLLSLDISNNPVLKRISSKGLCGIRSLKFLECVGTPQVRALPPEVAKLGGAEALEYLKSAVSQSEESKELQIIVIGNGEAGKSSLINCITNPKGISDKIHEDARTVGIEIREWKPAGFTLTDEDVKNQPIRLSQEPHTVDPDGLTCHFLDLAGQAVYGSSNQFFLVPRALYVMAWRVLEPAKTADNKAKAQELEAMIVNWLDSLQVRVPGCSVVMVATHIDAAAQNGEMTKTSWAEVELQCTFVQKIVKRKLEQIRHEASVAGVAPLEVYANAQSLKLQCLEGFGVPNLRRTLIEMAQGLPSWRELIPTSYHELRLKILQLRQDPTDPKVWLSWADYVKLAQGFGVTDMHIVIATSFLNDMAVIKYFGTLTLEGHPEDAHDVLDNTVFISPAWIIDGLKGLIRHDRDILIEYCQHELRGEVKQVMLRQVNRLASHGACESNLIPFLWPGGPGMDPESLNYWNWLKQQQKEDELRLWPGLIRGMPFARSQDDYERVMALLKGCDFVYKRTSKNVLKGSQGEYLAPVLVSHEGSLDARSYSDADCHIKHEYEITGTAPGFFDRVLVRIQQVYSHMEHSKNVGVFYGRGLKAQIFLVQHESASEKKGAKVASAPQSQSSKLVKSSRAVPGVSALQRYDQDSLDGGGADPQVRYTLTVLTSTRRQHVYIAKALRDLHDFFPGLSIGPYPNDMLFADTGLAKLEPVHVRIAALTAGKAERVKKLLLDAETQSDHGERFMSNFRLQLRIDAGAIDMARGEGEEKNLEKYMDFDSRVVLVCMEQFEDVKHDVQAMSSLRHILTEYEKCHRCEGQILDENLRAAEAEEADLLRKQGDFVRRVSTRTSAGNCRHKRSGPCEDCCSDEATKLLGKKQYDDARQMLREAVLVRELRVRLH